LSAYKVPTRWIFATEHPTLASGRPDQRRIQDTVTQGKNTWDANPARLMHRGPGLRLWRAALRHKTSGPPPPDVKRSGAHQTMTGTRPTEAQPLWSCYLEASASKLSIFL
jgi:hypothetical protein